MARLGYSFTFEIRPLPPYSFRLTVKKPAGWSLFTPFEVYDKDRLWTANYLNGILVGIRLFSRGTIRKPRIAARVFLRKPPTRVQKEDIKRLLGKTLGAEQDLSAFYKMAKRDRILRHVVKNLYGMHDTFSSTVFSEAVLAILLQMAPLKRSNEMMSRFITNYGEVAEFDNRRVRAWPSPDRISRLRATDLARSCRMGYRAKNIVKLARKLQRESFPSAEELEDLEPKEAKRLLLELPGIGDYSADIIDPHGGFPIDVWSAEVFGKLFFGKEPKNNREAVEKVKAEGLRRWGRWSWMAFFYIVQDLEGLSKRLGLRLRLS